MPIKAIDDRLYLPIAGKIRLGIKTENANGKEYPENTPYFVLTDVPDVAKVYGEKPDEIHILFFSTDLEMIAPHYYKLFKGGYKDDKGNIVGGELLCKGNGDTAEHYSKRDHLTRIVPKRQCLAEHCPDWCDSRGVQQCKPALNLRFFMPLVHPMNIYQIDTTSVNNIKAIIGILELRARMFPEWFTSTVFKLRKIKDKATIFDKSGNKRLIDQFFLELIPFENFKEEFKVKSTERQEYFERMLGPVLRSKPIEVLGNQEVIESPMEDNYPAQVVAPIVIDEDAPMRELSESPDTMPLFQELCDLKGKVNDGNVRLSTTKKFKTSPKPKEALIEYLNLQISIEKKKKTPPLTTGGLI